MRSLLLTLFAGSAGLLLRPAGPGANGGDDGPGAVAAKSTRPPVAANTAEAQQALADRIDAALAAAWKEQQIEPVAPASDAAWLRRLSLDLCGVIPSRDEVAAFLADARPDKRSRKIDEYLADPRLADNLSFYWSNLLLMNAGKDAETTKKWLQPWLEGEFARATPFAVMTRKMLADADSTIDPGSLSYILSYRDAIETLAGVTARAFLGLQIQCAQCHDHPFDKWKQRDFNRFTGFFLDMRADHIPSGKKGVPLFRVLDMSPEWDLKERLHRIIAAAKEKGDAAMAGDSMMMSGDAPMTSSDAPASADAIPARPQSEENLAAVADLIKMARKTVAGEGPLAAFESDPQVLAQMTARLAPDARDLLQKYRDRRKNFGEAGFLDGTAYAAKEGEPRRAALADWIVSPQNPWFGKAAANRMWKMLFGKGLTEPVDDLSAGDDRVLPELLDELGRAFNDHGTDVRFFLGTLARTKAYALGNSLAEDAAEHDRVERWFAAHPLRSFTPEQMTNSLLRAVTFDETATKRTIGANAEGARLRLLDEMTIYFGVKGGGNESFKANIPQALFLMNGGYGDRGETLRKAGAFDAFSDSTRPAPERLRMIFFSTLGRVPSAAEADPLVALLDAKPAAKPDANAPAAGEPAPGAAFEDLFWALVNSTEFHTNH